MIAIDRKKNIPMFSIFTVHSQIIFLLHFFKIHRILLVFSSILVVYGVFLVYCIIILIIVQQNHYRRKRIK